MSRYYAIDKNNSEKFNDKINVIKYGDEVVLIGHDKYCKIIECDVIDSVYADEVTIKEAKELITEFTEQID